MPRAMVRGIYGNDPGLRLKGNETMNNNIHKAPNAPQVMAQMFFGASIPDAAGIQQPDMVTDTDFARFLNDNVTPAFPGFTVTTSQGYWKGKPEKVRVLSLLAADSNSFRETVRQYAERYKTEFGQEAVAYAFHACEFALDCWPYGPLSTYHKPGLGY